VPHLELESLDTAHGVGGGYASWNNAAFSIGGVGGWMDRDRIAFANGNDNWIVSTYHKGTGAIEQVQFPGPGALMMAPAAARAYSRSLRRSRMAMPANLIYAGGGHVAAWLAGSGEMHGLHTTTGVRMPEAGLLGMGPDASLAFKPDYHSEGPTYVQELGAAPRLLTLGHASALQLLGERRAIWMQGMAVCVDNLPIPAYHSEGGVWTARAVYVNDEWWICYYSGSKGIVLHPFRSAAAAYPLLPHGDGWHAIAASGPSTVRFVISKTEGEGPGDIWGYDIDVRTGFAMPVPYSSVQDPRTYPFQDMATINPAPPVSIPVFHFNHGVMTVPFKDPEVKAGTTYRMEDNSLGIYTERPDPSASVAIAASQDMRVLCTHDAPDVWVPPAVLRDWDVPCIEFYRLKHEMLGTSVDRWRENLQALLRVWPHDVGIVPMFYCQGGVPGGTPPELWSVNDVLEGLWHLSELVNISFRVKMVAPFAYKRDNGITAHPELMEAFNNLKGATVPDMLLMDVPSRPGPIEPPIEPPVEPPVSHEYLYHKEYRMSEKQIVVIKGPAGKYGRPDGRNTGPWGGLNRGWRGVIWDGTDASDDHYHFELTKPDNGYALFHPGVNGFFGADATAYAVSPGSDQFYIKPAEETRGGYESPCIYEGNQMASMKAGWIEYPDPDGGFPSCGFAIKVVA
jgi:hypothetical protein